MQIKELKILRYTNFSLLHKQEVKQKNIGGKRNVFDSVITRQIMKRKQVLEIENYTHIK